MRLPLLACVLCLLPHSPVAADPLDVGDPTARTIRVHFERSFGDPGAVAEDFDEGWPATWTVDGNVGRVETSIATHEMSRESLQGLGLTAVPNTFMHFVVEVDLTTLEATSLATSGALSNGIQGFAFDTRVLDAAAVGGFVGPDTGPLFCTSQQQVDDLCLLEPLFCGQTCTLVPGTGYDPLAGTLNLIGPEEQLGCDGAVCFGPFEMFATTGDLKLTEAVTSVPAASPSARVLLALLLVTAAASGARARGPGGSRRRSRAWCTSTSTAATTIAPARSVRCSGSRRSGG